MSSGLTLIDHPVSSFGQKVRIALREKQIPFNFEPLPTVASPQPDPKFAAANPRLEVPVLIDGDLKIFDSTIILNYLEDKWPDQVPLFPRDAAGRAKARMIEDVCDTHYEAINWGLGELVWMGRADGSLAEGLKSTAAKQIDEIFVWLEGQLGDQPYFGGNKHGWADLAIIPFVYRSSYFGVGPSDGSPMGSWFARMKQISSVSQTLAEFDAAAPGMAQMALDFKSGKRVREYRDHRLEWMVKSGGIDIVTAGMRDGNIRFSWP